MSELRNLQQAFMGHLLGKTTDIAKHIQSTATLSAKKRLDIYAYAYKERLKEAITTDYEKLHDYLGDEQFEQLLERYIEHYPSQQTNLRYYSTQMANLLRDEEPYRQHPILTEIAGIEAAFADSFDAQDSELVSIDTLTSLPPEAWETLSFTFHPSVQALTFKLNSFAVWKALANDMPPPKTEHLSTPDVWLLWRDSTLISRYRPVKIAEASALELVLAGRTFADMCEQLLNDFSEEEVPSQAIAYLTSWVNEGLIASLNT